jgi:hypothetical protein
MLHFALRCTQDAFWIIRKRNRKRVELRNNMIRSKQETHTFIFSSSGNAILLNSKRKTMEAYLFSKEFAASSLTTKYTIINKRLLAVYQRE